ncbi:MAG: hypothetical protein JOZ01_09065, partial [Candidatus Eremiobacteraeota bacterium]|nr:hypothetical protein [Candidatus Eremiobacteraeota bacterium]
MRLHLCLAVFLVALFAAACGGGGSGPVVPGKGGTSPGGTMPQDGKASMSLKIPKPQATTAGQKRPAYVSPATESIVIVVSSLQTPGPTPLPPQLFPIATPSPCTQNPDGSKVCTFNVNVPFGNDQIVASMYAVPNPGPSDVPLGTLSVTFSVEPGVAPTIPPVVASGNVSYVTVAIASPQPSFTPQTRIVTAASPYAAQPLMVTPYDASGTQILTDTF